MRNTNATKHTLALALVKFHIPYANDLTIQFDLTRRADTYYSQNQALEFNATRWQKSLCKFRVHDYDFIIIMCVSVWILCVCGGYPRIYFLASNDDTCPAHIARASVPVQYARRRHTHTHGSTEDKIKLLFNIIWCTSYLIRDTLLKLHATLFHACVHALCCSVRSSLFHLPGFPSR